VEFGLKRPQAAVGKVETPYNATAILSWTSKFPCNVTLNCAMNFMSCYIHRNQDRDY
jgi:hypothetical protein